MHACTYCMYSATAPCCCYVLLKWLRKPACCRRQNWRELLFPLHISWGLCFCECWLGSVCLCAFERRNGRLEVKWKCVFRSFTGRLFHRPTFSHTFSRLGAPRLLGASLISSFHADIPAVGLRVCILACAALMKLRLLLLVVLPPPNVISLPLGPWQTHQTGRKWSALLGRLSGLPLDLWPTDSVYHSAERQSKKGRGGRKTVKGTEHPYPPFTRRTAQTDWNHFWKRIIKRLHC